MKRREAGSFEESAVRHGERITSSGSYLHPHLKRSSGRQNPLRVAVLWSTLPGWSFRLNRRSRKHCKLQRLFPGTREGTHSELPCKSIRNRLVETASQNSAARLMNRFPNSVQLSAIFRRSHCRARFPDLSPVNNPSCRSAPSHRVLESSVAAV